MSEFRRQHLETVADGGAGIAAKPRNGIDRGRIDVQPLRIDHPVVTRAIGRGMMVPIISL
ncbi:hypothetical protein A6U98_27040 [Rhizobium sp. WYCCWR10014]|nr:hypothetical protein A6U98_27040 [Rhizobium sp. WYCCWR10014]